MDQSSGGVPGIHRCHSPSTSAAALHGYCRVNSAMSGIGWASKVNDVTTPKLPPPPPLDAHSRSACSAGSAVTTRESAVTISTDRRLSQVSPYLRPKTPMPPPRVSPAMPTVGHEPPGRRRPEPPSVL